MTLRRQITPNEAACNDKMQPAMTNHFNKCAPVRHRDKDPLPAFVLDMIASTPRAGDGVHTYLFKLARQLHHHRTPEEITDLLRAVVEGCGRIVDDSEIAAAVESSKTCAWQPKSSRECNKSPSKWPAANAKAREAAINNSDLKSLADFWDASPWRCDDGTDAERYVDELFPGNPLLCLAYDSSHFDTAPRETFRSAVAEHSLIVPSPMTSVWGIRKKDGARSMHTLDNTGPRRFLVTEFDKGEFDDQAAIIGHLSDYAPLVMVLWSGSKSIHAWWSCGGADEAQQLGFFRYAVSLGADPATWSRCQFVRLPQGWRQDKGVRQFVYYFNPGALPVEGGGV